MKERIYIALGVCCLVLTFAALLLPLIPMTPFVVLAGVCFARGSERVHQRFLNFPGVGRVLRQWEDSHTIDPRVKWWGTAFGVATLAVVLSIVEMPRAAQISAIAFCTLFSAFTLSRPSGSLPARVARDGVARDRTENAGRETTKRPATRTGSTAV